MSSLNGSPKTWTNSCGRVHSARLLCGPKTTCWPSHGHGKRFLGVSNAPPFFELTRSSNLHSRRATITPSPDNPAHAGFLKKTRRPACSGLCAARPTRGRNPTTPFQEATVDFASTMPKRRSLSSSRTDREFGALRSVRITGGEQDASFLARDHGGCCSKAKLRERSSRTRPRRLRISQASMTAALARGSRGFS